MPQLVPLRRLVARPASAASLAALGLFLALHVHLKLALPRAVPAGGPWPAAAAAPRPSAGRGPTPAQLARLPLAADARLVVLVFFESWCGPCELELPALERLLAQQAGAGLSVVGIFGPTSDADIEAFRRRLGLTFPLVRDGDGGLAATMKVDAVPTSFVLGAERTIVRAVRGFDPALVAWLTAELAGGGGAR